MKVIVEVIAVSGPDLESPVEIDKRSILELPEGTQAIKVESLVEEEARRLAAEAKAMLVWFGWEFAKEGQTA
jgi:hypothetical protein